MKLGAVDDGMLHITALFAIKTGVQKLAEIVAEGPRWKRTERDGKASTTEEPISTDLDAAKALVAFGLKAKALVSMKVIKAPDDSADKNKPAQPDLWDVAALGPWKSLKNPTAQ